MFLEYVYTVYMCASHVASRVLVDHVNRHLWSGTWSKACVCRNVENHILLWTVFLRVSLYMYVLCTQLYIQDM